MTANTSVLGTGATAGTYVASASTSINGTQPFNAFRLSLWHSASTYNVSTGLYIGTVTTSGLGGATYSGEWLQLQLPFPIRLGSYTIRGRQDQNLFLNRSPNTFVILGSDTGANGSWRLLDSRTDATFTADAQTFTIASPPSYACTSVWSSVV
jgi:hypothetical protein